MLTELGAARWNQSRYRRNMGISDHSDEESGPVRAGAGLDKPSPTHRERITLTVALIALVSGLIIGAVGIATTDPSYGSPSSPLVLPGFVLVIAGLVTVMVVLMALLPRFFRYDRALLANRRARK